MKDKPFAGDRDFRASSLGTLLAWLEANGDNKNTEMDELADRMTSEAMRSIEQPASGKASATDPASDATPGAKAIEQA